MFESCHVVICRARELLSLGDVNTASQPFEERVLQSLRKEKNLAVTMVPHLIDLATDGPAFERLRLIEGRMIVLGWISSRAAYWLLRAAGVSGVKDELSESPKNDTRSIWCLDLRQYERPEECVQAIRHIMSQWGESAMTPLDEQNGLERIDEKVSARWYPVIDYDRCANCLECLNFCLFGVYSLDSTETVFVEQPDACRPGCPACARVCPSGAIMFPEHTDPTISGEAIEGRSKGEDIPPKQNAYLDELVDEVDEFDL